VRKQRCNANRFFAVLSTLFCLSGPFAAGVSAFSQTTVAHDNGNLRFVIDAKGRPTEHVYDALNRRIQTILRAGPIDLNGDGLLGSNENSVITSTQTSYDELGRRVSETDAIIAPSATATTSSAACAT
jgi:YD repeat-containing protein